MENEKYLILEPPSEKVLSAKEIIKYMVMITLAMFVGAIFSGLCSLLLDKRFLVLFAVIGGGGLGIFSIWFFLKYRKSFTWADLGFRTPRYRLFHLFWQIPLSFIGSLAFAGLVGKLLNIGPAEKVPPLDHTLFNSGGILIWITIVAYFLSGVLLIPIVEEIVFRKLLTDLTAKRFGMVSSILVNSIIFALIHVSPSAMLYIFPLGVALNILYRRYDTLWASFALHAINNLFVLSIVLSAIA